MSAPTETPRRPHGAVSVRGGKVKRPLGWLPWVALLLAGLLCLLALVVARNAGDAGDEPGVDLIDDPAAEGEDEPGPSAG